MTDPRTDVILATGGVPVVRAAYSSGNPAIGVGPGNVPVLVDATADLPRAAKKLVDSKAFDNSVEAQLRTPTSLLRWLHRFIALRKAHPVFGLGTYDVIRPENTKIFAHIRRWEDDIVLAVHNVARSAQAVELDLSRFAGHVPEEMFGHSRFPAIGELPYLLTLAPRGYFWFLLRPPESE